MAASANTAGDRVSDGFNYTYCLRLPMGYCTLVSFFFFFDFLVLLKIQYCLKKNYFVDKQRPKTASCLVCWNLGPLGTVTPGLATLQSTSTRPGFFFLKVDATCIFCERDNNKRMGPCLKLIWFYALIFFFFLGAFGFLGFKCTKGPELYYCDKTHFRP